MDDKCDESIGYFCTYGMMYRLSYINGRDKVVDIKRKISECVEDTTDIKVSIDDIILTRKRVRLEDEDIYYTNGVEKEVSVSIRNSRYTNYVRTAKAKKKRMSKVAE